MIDLALREAKLRAVKGRDHPGFCPYCGSFLTWKKHRARARSRDHILPKAWGGSNAITNLRICCRRCNIDRGYAGHCIAALACARAVANATGVTQGHVLSSWRLPHALRALATPAQSETLLMYRHVAFNPMMVLRGSLQTICDEHERAGWCLLRVVYWSTLEAIAVFERGETAQSEGK